MFLMAFLTYDFYFIFLLCSTICFAIFSTFVCKLLATHQIYSRLSNNFHAAQLETLRSSNQINSILCFITPNAAYQFAFLQTSICVAIDFFVFLNLALRLFIFLRFYIRIFTFYSVPHTNTYAVFCYFATSHITLYTHRMLNNAHLNKLTTLL